MLTDQARDPEADQRPRTSKEDPNFLEKFYKASRLHYIGMWNQRYQEREFFIDNLLVRIHFIIVMVGWTGLAPALHRHVEPAVIPNPAPCTLNEV